MKNCCFVLLLFFAFLSFGQEPNTTNTPHKNKKASFQLYPNPAVNEVVYITTPGNAKKDIKVYDVFGEIVLTDRISSKSLNISRLVAGVYVLQVIENGETMARKLVVK